MLCKVKMDILIFPAVKAYDDPAVINLLAFLGAGLDCSSKVNDSYVPGTQIINEACRDSIDFLTKCMIRDRSLIMGRVDYKMRKSQV